MRYETLEAKDNKKSISKLMDDYESLSKKLKGMARDFDGPSKGEAIHLLNQAIHELDKSSSTMVKIHKMF